MQDSLLGSFALEQCLGSGSTGTVYSATHVEARKLVAVKILRPDLVSRLVSSEMAMAEFLGHLKNLRLLAHPGIARYYGGGRADHDVYLVTELVHGEPLAARLARCGRLELDVVLRYAAAICDALQSAQTRGFLHRNLSAANVLVTDDVTDEGQIKLTDFGIAGVTYGYRAEGAPRVTGNPAYLSPEQLRGEPGTARSDVYALGVLLFQMLSGKLPKHPADGHGEPPHISSLVMDCPVWLDALVTQMLQRDPDKRPRDAGAVAVALEEVQQNMAAGLGVTAHAAAGQLSLLKVPQERAEQNQLLGRKRPRKKVPLYRQAWLRAVGLAGGIVLIVGAIVWGVWPPGEEELFAKAQALMATGDVDKWQEAKANYLGPLRERFPAGKHAVKVQEYLDQIEMDEAERRMNVHLRLRRPPKSEGERLYIDALEFEQFGDRRTALEKYDGLARLLAGRDDARGYVNLAKRQMGRFAKEGKPPVERPQFVEAKLAEADKLLAEGDRPAAAKIWQSIVALYGGYPELRSLVERAQERLAADEKGTRALPPGAVP
ncbi:MAG: serine/threonine protein kinase [Planctomycetia bacterium]|nr:serine/threonine protein kinase [Planctomycetia bacterium]